MAEIETNNLNQADISEQKQIRLDKLAELKANNNDPYQITKFDVTDKAGDIKANFSEYEGKTVTVAGRLMFKRKMGKASFCDVRDSSDRIQSYVRIDDVGEEAYTAFKKFDIGDIVGLTGFVFLTKTGEISIHATDIKLLSK